MSSSSAEVCSVVFTQYTIEHILQVLNTFYTSCNNLHYQNKNSLFGRAAKHLTNHESTYAERQYLYKLWVEKHQVWPKTTLLTTEILPLKISSIYIF